MLTKSEIKELKLKYGTIFRYVVNNNEYIVRQPKVDDFYKIESAISDEVENYIRISLLDLVISPDVIEDLDKEELVDKISKLTYFFEKEKWDNLQEKTIPEKSSRIIQSKLLIMRVFPQFKYSDFSNMEIKEFYTISNIANTILNSTQESDIKMSQSLEQQLVHETDPKRKQAIIEAERQRQILSKELNKKRRFRKLS